MKCASVRPFGSSRDLQFLAGFLLLLSGVAAGWAGDLDTIGVTLLRLTDPTLTGIAVKGAQPEAGSPAWEVNPAAVGQPESLFTYWSSTGTDTNFPNALGSESGHADEVGYLFYGPGGVAGSLGHLDNYEAQYFATTLIASQSAIAAKVVNQSFILSTASTLEQQTFDSSYDNYVAQFNTIFASGAGNGGAVNAPSTAYNGLSVAAYGPNAMSSVGPTPDNGRSKPDLTAPAQVTSFSTPLVSGAAAILVQAGGRGDGGPGTAAAATDVRTIKALLLNGAIKPVDWSHTTNAPLDTRYGAGVLNVFNSYKQLTGGKHAFIVSTTNPAGGAHPPTGDTGTVAGLVGWDFNTISSSVISDRVNHYYFDLNRNVGSSFTVTATLVWNRQANQTSINDLDLFLYDTRNTNLLASSVSSVDNVEHLFLTGVAPGRYDLQVLKNGGLTKKVSNQESYALAFEIFSMRLNIARSGPQVMVSWPISPMGFRLEGTPILGSPGVWTTLTNPPAVLNGFNTVTAAAGTGAQFYRLQRP